MKLTDVRPRCRFGGTHGAPYPTTRSQKSKAGRPFEPALIASLALRAAHKLMDLGLADPANIGHPALLRVSPLPTPNNEESHENPDQRAYHKQLHHKTALWLFRIRIGEVRRAAGSYLRMLLRVDKQQTQFAGWSKSR